MSWHFLADTSIYDTIRDDCRTMGRNSIPVISAPAEHLYRAPFQALDGKAENSTFHLP
jgi:hypothetical protein